MSKVKKPFSSQNSGRVPLCRALSKLGKASREEAKALILEGKVKVHGSVERNPDRMVNPDRAHIEISGTKATKEKPRLILFHKPTGYLTTKRDPEGRPTIYDLLPEEFRSFHPVGRLDLHTSGLLLLTNESKISHFLTNPENQIPRSYVVLVRGQITEEQISRMKAGVTDDGELLTFTDVELLKASRKESTLKVILTEGKYREIRRMFDVMKSEVVRLKRIEFGPYQLGELQSGRVVEVETKFVDSVI